MRDQLITRMLLHNSNQPTGSPIATTQSLPHPVDDPQSSDTHIARETTGNPSLLPSQVFRDYAEGKQFAIHLPKLEIPGFSGEPLN